MNDARPYASLSSGLLARKGAAKPAMRPQSYGGFEDLGWNDMGYGRSEGPTFEAHEHVPSSIAALTPAPKGGRGDFADYGEEPEELEGHEAYLDDPEELETQEPQPVEAAEPEPFEAEPRSFEAEPRSFEAEPQPVAEEIAKTPSVVAQQRAILERFDGELEEAEEPAPPVAAPARARAAKADIVSLPKRKSKAGAGRKAAFTLRLDSDRHLRLRLACAVTGRSAQQIVSRALDDALSAIPEIEALAARVPAAGAKRN